MIRFVPVVISLLILVARASGQNPPDVGVLPVGADGKPLNLDFETGTLKDWTAEGDAFVGQPVRGDTVSARRSDMKSRHQGQYWIGGWEKKHDAATRMARWPAPARPTRPGAWPSSARSPLRASKMSAPAPGGRWSFRSTSGETESG